MQVGSGAVGLVGAGGRPACLEGSCRFWALRCLARPGTAPACPAAALQESVQRPQGAAIARAEYFVGSAMA
eukprot:1249064-Pyramimonas_sp.AAC.1